MGLRSDVKGLDAEQRAFLHAHRARGFSYARCRSDLFIKYPICPRYSLATIRRYLDTDEIVLEVSAMKAKIDAEAIKVSYSLKGNRLDLLHERADSLQTLLRELEDPAPKFKLLTVEEQELIDNGQMAEPEPELIARDYRAIASLTAELRQVTKQIQQEADPDDAPVIIMAPFEQYLKARAEHGGSAEDIRAKLEAETYSTLEPS